MNHGDRAIAAMRGLPVDHIPFIARMDLWYAFHKNRGTLPSPYENASLWDIQRDMGVGIFGKGYWGELSFYRLVHRDIEITRNVNGDMWTTRYDTPYGSLTCSDRLTKELKDAVAVSIRTQYPFKKEQDYDALQFLVEHTEVEETFEPYRQYMEAIGADGVAVPTTGHLPAHQLMLHYMGYQAFYYELVDHPSQVETLIEALTEQHRHVLALANDCPAEVIEVGANYDEQMTPPPVFDAFFAPFYLEAKQILASRNKILQVHGDGNMKILLEKLMACGVDVVESLTPKPMTSIDIAETRRLWKDRVTMWGGLATVMLTEAFSEQQFEDFLENLFQAVSPGDRFILGFADNVPTDALFPRIKRVVEFWAEKGHYPLPV